MSTCRTACVGQSSRLETDPVFLQLFEFVEQSGGLTGLALPPSQGIFLKQPTPLLRRQAFRAFPQRQTRYPIDLVAAETHTLEVFKNNEGTLLIVLKIQNPRF
jgi:hypothetical protein